ncbi:MAG: bacteriohemerythrin [Spirochaetaceae bacterium]|jgi:hemerythrin|nr:bacteriohemerythrin [Spirochaetaceae bacterium]
MLLNTGSTGPNHKEYVTWSDSYSMGVKIIDDQHKGLLDFVNDLFNHSTGNEVEEYAYFKEVIQQAVQYVKDHFQTEEKLMIATKFANYPGHKKAHDTFTLTVLKSVKDFESGKRLVLEKFAYFLKDWILTHIAVMDRQYAEYFRKIATRKADGKLTITIEDLEKQSSP